METNMPLIKANRILGGFSLAVRDDWNFHIRTTHISEQDKNLYLETFGEQIITYDQFYDWWCEIHKVGKYAETENNDNYTSYSIGRYSKED